MFSCYFCFCSVYIILLFGRYLTVIKTVACVASVPVRTKCYVSRELRFWSRENWGESKKGKGAGRGWGSEGTLASKPHDSEKPVRPRTGLLIGAARSC